MAGNSDRVRLSAVDGIRALAALAVIATHIVPIGDPRWGATAVTVFFVLSGFLLFLSAVRARFHNGPADLAAYVVARLFRILPLYVLALAVYALLMPTALMGPDPPGPWFVKHVLFIEADAHFWSIKQELLLYLLLPAFGMVCALLRRRRYMAVFLAGSIAAAYVLCNVQGQFMVWGVRTWNPFGVGPFLVGMLLAIVADRVPRAWGRPMMFAACAGIAMCSTTSAELAIVVMLGKIDISPLYWALGGMLVLGAYLDNHGPFAWRPLRAVGEAGYGVYVWHALVLYLVYAATGYDGWRALGLTVALTIPLALLTFSVVEQSGVRYGRDVAQRIRLWVAASVRPIAAG